MQKKANIFLIMLISLFLTTNIFCGERTVPVDIFLMIDKSLSMEDPGKFDSLHKWVRQELIGQMLIPGDWITIYQFYEKPEEVLTLNIKDENSRRTVINAIDAIRPDGKFTDIGAALDKIQTILQERGTNGRFKVLLLVTDLEHDAPWESKYRGKQESFESPYLAEARIIKRDNWYEVTLDMDIQDTVVKRTQSLYSDVLSNDGKPRSGDDQSKSLIEGNTTVVTNKSGNTTSDTDGDKNSNKNNSNDTNSNSNNTKSNTDDTETNDVATGKNANTDSTTNNINNESNTEKQNNIANSENNNNEQTKASQKNTLAKLQINKRMMYIIILLIAILLLILLLFLLIRYIRKKQEEKRRREKAKKQLQEDEKTL
ncbi:MAG: hypothetical protein CR988_03815 [Treponema sp.]|nr:MAG: hypothetical protein CR988_03815 [Treponema sp.]